MKTIHLGQASDYIQTYTPELLQPIARTVRNLDFFGYDLWHSYEISWLNLQGKPEVCVSEFIFPCKSPYLIESKSFKLYLNSLNQTPFESFLVLSKTLEKDLSLACGDTVTVKLIPLSKIDPMLQTLSGICLDTQDIACDTYEVNPDYLSHDSHVVTETVYSHLLKTNCPVTQQPDWGSVSLAYTGKKINPEGLLRYIVSFRNHADFHEQCVERIFTDIWQRTQPEKLTVAAYYTRRGGLDICPVRSSHDILIEPLRLWRQ